MLEDVVSADWTPDGQQLAAIQITGGEYQLQFPIGKSLYETQGKLGWLAFSPRGDRLAFIEYPLISDEAGTLKIVDLEGRATTLSSGWRTVRGVDWSSSGDEIWVTASDHGRRCSLYGVSLTGTKRLLFHAPGDVMLLDLFHDHRALLATTEPRTHMIWSRGGDERDLSWLDWSTAADLSADGKTVLFYEWGEGVGASPFVCVRSADGSDVVRLGPGKALALSPDGRWALALQEGARPQLVADADRRRGDQAASSGRTHGFLLGQMVSRWTSHTRRRVRRRRDPPLLHPGLRDRQAGSDRRERDACGAAIARGPEDSVQRPAGIVSALSSRRREAAADRGVDIRGLADSVEPGREIPLSPARRGRRAEHLPLQPGQRRSGSCGRRLRPAIPPASSGLPPVGASSR